MPGEDAGDRLEPAYIKSAVSGGESAGPGADARINQVVEGFFSPLSQRSSLQTGPEALGLLDQRRDLRISDLSHGRTLFG